jgi:putative ABC transport system ATP-binding protein
MIAIAFSYSSARYRLGVMRTGDRVGALLAARAKLADLPQRDERFARFDHARFHPAFTIAKNIFFGPVRIERRDSWQPFKSRVDDLVAELGLRDLILRAGVDQPVGEGGQPLNAQQRRRLGLARALMKNPLTLVVDQIAGTASDADVALRALLRREVDAHAPDGAGALIYAAADEAGAEGADHVIRIGRDGTVTQESRGGGDAAGPEARPRPVDGGSDADR